MPNDAADRFRRGDRFKCRHGEGRAFGVVYEFDRAVIIYKKDGRYRTSGSDVPEDAAHLRMSETIPQQVELALQAAEIAGDC